MVVGLANSYVYLGCVGEESRVYTVWVRGGYILQLLTGSTAGA